MPFIEHRDGVPWHDAPVPRKWHRCSAQSWGWVGSYGLRYVERCACGAIRLHKKHPWDERNTRSRSTSNGRNA